MRPQRLRHFRLGAACAALSVSILAALAFGPAAAQQERVFFGNLHSHTSYSDGSGTPEQAYRHAREAAGLDFLALTEHNHNQALGPDNLGIGADASLYKGPGPDSLISTANRMTEDGAFVALYGQEFSTISSGNHVNVFDIGEVIDVEKGRFDTLLDFLAINRDTTNKPAILMLNHPKNTLAVDPKEYGRDDFGTVENWVTRMGAQTHLMQMINGPGQEPGDNHRPASPDERAFIKYLNWGFKVAPTADQDNHHENWGTATPARTGVVAANLTKASLLDAFRKRHVYASQDQNLSVIIRVNGRLCGDVISPLPPAGELAIQYTIADPDVEESNADYVIQVFRDSVGGPVAQMVTSVPTAAGGGTGTIEDVAFSGEPQFFFFKVVQFDEDGDEDRVWTAPIWFQAQGQAPVPGPVPEPVTAVASRRSGTFHVSANCLDARRIKPGNRVTGAAARQGRQQHPGCPRQR